MIFINNVWDFKNGLFYSVSNKNNSKEKNLNEFQINLYNKILSKPSISVKNLSEHFILSREVINNELKLFCNERLLEKNILKKYVPDKNRGYVYLLKTEGYDFYKIGLTNNIEKRVRNIENNLPFYLDIIHIIESDDITKVESFLLKKFSNKRIKNE